MEGPKRNSLSANFRPARMAQRSENCLKEILGEIAMPVKMPATHSWTKRPREALLQLDIGLLVNMFRIGGSLRALVRYHPY